MTRTTRYISIMTAALLVSTISLAAAPTPAHAFTLFGIRFFEKPTPTPTPTPTITPTPTPVTVPSITPTPVVGQNDNLPTTGPAENIGMLLLAVVGGFIARKYLQISR